MPPADNPAFSSAALDSPGLFLRRKLSHHLPLDAAERQALDVVLGRSIRHVSHRALLVDAPTVPSEIHVLVEGWACRFATLPNGRRQIVALYVPGDVCDFDVFLMKRMDQSIAAIGRIRVASVNRRSLNELSRTQRRISQGLWWESMANASIQRAWTINVGLRGARQRLAHLLCELHTRLSLVGLVQDGACELPLTQTDLGDACAMTAIHTNRALQGLRQDGLLDLEGGRLRIHRWKALASFAEFDPGYLQVPALISPEEEPALAIEA